MKSVILAVLCAATWATAQTKQPSSKEPKDQQKITDTWQRQKDCLEFGEHLIVKYEPIIKFDTNWRMTDWHPHYSPKYGHCFVSLTYFRISSAKDDPKQAEREPLKREEMWDALENIVLASWAAPPPKSSSVYCSIGRNEADCDAAHRFVDDHMDN